MEMRYDDSSAATPSDKIWLKATVEPMLMSENKTEKQMVKKTAAEENKLVPASWNREKT